jgi:hypothetical protein
MVTLVNRAKVGTTTTGTGTITLGPAKVGYQTLADAGVVDTNVVRYVIEDGSDFEIGTGTYTASGTTLSRTVIESSNSDAALSLSGSAVVFVSATAEDLAVLDITALGSSEANKAVTADANGDVTLSQELKATSYNESYIAVTSTSNATTVNSEAGNTFMHTLTENTTFTFSNPPASGTAYTMSIEIIQDASASGFVVTWPASIDWPAATAPTLTATASAVDVFVFTTRDGGTNWYGFTAGQAFA